MGRRHRHKSDQQDVNASSGEAEEGAEANANKDQQATASKYAPSVEAEGHDSETDDANVKDEALAKKERKAQRQLRRERKKERDELRQKAWEGKAKEKKKESDESAENGEPDGDGADEAIVREFQLFQEFKELRGLYGSGSGKIGENFTSFLKKFKEVDLAEKQKAALKEKSSLKSSKASRRSQFAKAEGNAPSQRESRSSKTHGRRDHLHRHRRHSSADSQSSSSDDDASSHRSHRAFDRRHARRHRSADSSPESCSEDEATQPQRHKRHAARSSKSGQPHSSKEKKLLARHKGSIAKKSHHRRSASPSASSVSSPSSPSSSSSMSSDELVAVSGTSKQRSDGRRESSQKHDSKKLEERRRTRHSARHSHRRQHSSIAASDSPQGSETSEGSDGEASSRHKRKGSRRKVASESVSQRHPKRHDLQDFAKVDLALPRSPKPSPSTSSKQHHSLGRHAVSTALASSLGLGAASVASGTSLGVRSTTVLHLSKDHVYPSVIFTVNFKMHKQSHRCVALCGSIPELGGSVFPNTVKGSAVMLEENADGIDAQDHWQSQPITIRSVQAGHRVEYIYFIWDCQSKQVTKVETLAPGRSGKHKIGTRWFDVPKVNQAAIKAAKTDAEKEAYSHFFHADARFGDLSQPPRIVIKRLRDDSEADSSPDM